MIQLLGFILKYSRKKETKTNQTSKQTTTKKGEKIKKMGKM